MHRRIYGRIFWRPEILLSKMCCLCPAELESVISLKVHKSIYRHMYL